MEIYKHTVTFYSTSKEAGSEVSSVLEGHTDFGWDCVDSNGNNNIVLHSAYTTKKMKIVEDK